MRLLAIWLEESGLNTLPRNVPLAVYGYGVESKNSGYHHPCSQDVDGSGCRQVVRNTFRMNILPRRAILVHKGIGKGPSSLSGAKGQSSLTGPKGGEGSEIQGHDFPIRSVQSITKGEKPNPAWSSTKPSSSSKPPSKSPGKFPGKLPTNPPTKAPGKSLSQSPGKPSSKSLRGRSFEEHLTSEWLKALVLETFIVLYMEDMDLAESDDLEADNLTYLFA